MKSIFLGITFLFMSLSAFSQLNNVTLLGLKKGETSTQLELATVTASGTQAFIIERNKDSTSRLIEDASSQAKSFQVAKLTYTLPNGDITTLILNQVRLTNYTLTKNKGSKEIETFTLQFSSQNLAY